jgi:transcriptional regulator with XRE-family HTH domain
MIATMSSTARVVRTARRRAGLSQRALADRAGVPQPSVARIESGASIPRADTLERILHAAGYELAVEPRLGIGVDRTIIRERLAMSPDERGRAATVAARNLAAFQRAVRSRGRPAGS